jgi:hypothetical protein
MRLSLSFLRSINISLFSLLSIVCNLNTATTYYWKIVVKDNNGGQAIGQVWSFYSN